MDDGVRRHHHLQVVGAHDLLALEGPVAEQHAQPLRHVADRRVDTAGRPVGVRPGELRGVGGEGGHRTADELVRRRRIGGGREALLPGRARLHPERVEDAVLDVRRPRLSAARVCEIARHEKEVVHVSELAAEARHGLDVPHLRDDVVGGEAEEGHPVAGIRRHAAVLRHQIRDLELACHPRIAHLEARHVIDDAIAPADLPVVDLHGHHRRGEGLRRRADLEDRVRSHRSGAAHALHAEALRVDHLVVLHDRDRHAWNAPLRLRGLRIGLERGEPIARRDGGLGAGAPRHGEDRGNGRQQTDGREPAWMHHASSVCRCRDVRSLLACEMGCVKRGRGQPDRPRTCDVVLRPCLHARRCPTRKAYASCMFARSPSRAAPKVGAPRAFPRGNR